MSFFGEQNMKSVKRPNIPKVRYQGRTYDIIGKSGSIIRISDGFAEFPIEHDLAKPCNKEARELYKEMV